MSSYINLDFRSDIGRFSLSAALIIISIVVIFGNILLIYALLSNRKQRKQHANLYVINLAISDIILAFFVMLPDLHATLNDKWSSFGVIGCYINCAINYQCIIVTMATFAWIGIDRYIAIGDPLHYGQRTGRRGTSLQIVSTWITGIPFAIVPNIVNWVSFDYWELGCAIDWFIDDIGIIIYVIVANIVCFISPLIVMSFCYINIMLILKPFSKNNTAQQMITNSSKIQARNKKIVIANLVLLATFIITLTPFCITKLLKATSRRRDFVHPYLNAWSTLFQFLGSALSPLLYGMLRREIFNSLVDDFNKLIKQFCHSK